MAIDKLSVYKIGEDLMENLSVNEHKENEAVIQPMQHPALPKKDKEDKETPWTEKPKS